VEATHAEAKFTAMMQASVQQQQSFQCSFSFIK